MIWYQKKHSPIHTYPDHQSSIVCFLNLLRSLASSCSMYVFSLSSVFCCRAGSEYPVLGNSQGGFPLPSSRFVITYCDQSFTSLALFVRGTLPILLSTLEGVPLSTTWDAGGRCSGPAVCQSLTSADPTSMYVTDLIVSNNLVGQTHRESCSQWLSKLTGERAAEYVEHLLMFVEALENDEVQTNFCINVHDNVIDTI